MDFEQKLARVSDIERKILQCLSLFWEPISANDIQKLLKVLGFRTPEGKSYPIQQVSMIRNLLMDMTDKLAFELRADQKLTGCATVKIRYADFNTFTKQRRITYTASDNVLARTVLELFDQLYERRQLIRLIGVKFSDLVHGNYQIDLFEDTMEQISLLNQMDRIRKRFGQDAVMRASGLSSKR